MMRKRPIDPICKRFVSVKTFPCFMTYGIHGETFPRPILGVKTNNFETIVHACHKKVMFTFSRWMPLYSPGSTSDIHVRESLQGLACIEKSNLVVITVTVLNLPQAWSSVEPTFQLR